MTGPAAYTTGVPNLAPPPFVSQLGSCPMHWPWNARGDGNGDDTIAVQNCRNYCRVNGKQFYGGSGWLYRITAPLGTQSDGNFQAVNEDWQTATILVDFAGQDAFTITGGAALQRVHNVNIMPTLARRHVSGAAYVAANCGIHITNARHDVTGTASYFDGDGFLVESSAANSNYSRHDVEVYGNGRGARVFGANDNLSVIASTIKAYGNSEEGIRVDAGTMFRQWICFWKSEGNLLADPNNAAKNDVHVLKAITSVFFVYSEHSAGTAGEFYLDPVNATNCEAWSARRNKDTIYGSNCGRWGNLFYQTGDNNRRTILSDLGLNTRKGNAGEYVRRTFEAGDGTIGYVGAEANAGRLGSAGGSEIAIFDKRGAIIAADLPSGFVALTGGAPTVTINICTLAAGSSVAGRFTVSGSAPGAGFFNFIQDFSCNGIALVTNAAIVNQAAAPNPTTAVLQVVGNILQVVLTYVPGQWGAAYAMRYFFAGSFVNVTMA